MIIEMKNGFNYQGAEVEATVGSYGRAGRRAGRHARTATSRPMPRSMPSMTTAGANSPRPRTCAACISTSAPATSRPNSTSTSPAPTTSRRCRGDPGRVAQSAMVERLYVAADDASAARIPHHQPELQSDRYAAGAGQRLLSRLLAVACGRQRHRRAALRSSGALAGQLCIGDGNTPIKQKWPGRRTRSRQMRFSARSTATRPQPTASAARLQVTSTDKVFEHDNHFVSAAASITATRCSPATASSGRSTRSWR